MDPWRQSFTDAPRRLLAARWLEQQFTVPQPPELVWRGLLPG